MKTIYLSLLFVLFSVAAYAQPPVQDPIVIRYAQNGLDPVANPCASEVKVCLEICWTTTPNDFDCIYGQCQLICDDQVLFQENLAAILDPGIGTPENLHICSADLKISIPGCEMEWSRSINDIAVWPLNTWMDFYLCDCHFKVYYGVVGGQRQYTIWPIPNIPIVGPGGY